MFGGQEILIVGVIVVVLFYAPSRLPNLAKSVAKSIKGFKTAMSEDDEVDVTDSARAEELHPSDSDKVITREKQKDEA